MLTSHFYNQLSKISKLYSKYVEKDFNRKRHNPYAFFQLIQNTNPMHSERVGYAYLTTEKELLDKKEKLTCLCFHHVHF